MGRGDKQGLLAISAEDIEWIIPANGRWPAGDSRLAKLNAPSPVNTVAASNSLGFYYARDLRVCKCPLRRAEACDNSQSKQR